MRSPVNLPYKLPQPKTICLFSEYVQQGSTITKASSTRGILMVLVFAVLCLLATGEVNAQSYDTATLESYSTAREKTDGSEKPEIDGSATQQSEELSDPAAVYARSTSASSQFGYDQETISNWRNSNTTLLGERLDILWDELPLAWERISRAFSLATDPESGWTSQRVIGSIVLVIIIAVLFELFTTRKLLKRLYGYANTQDRSRTKKYKFIATRICIQLIGVAVLGITAYVMGLFFINQNEYLKFLFVEILKGLIQFRLWLILMRNVFSPARADFRPIPMEDAPARQLYFWFSIFFAVISFGAVFNRYLQTAGLDPVLLSGLLIPYTLALNLIILSQVWLMRNKITSMFVNSEDRMNQGLGKLFLTQSWPFLFSSWMIMLWMLWLYNAFIGNWDQAGHVSKSWWIALAFPIVDRMFYGLIKHVENFEWLQSPRYEQRSARFVVVVQTGFRFVLIGIALYLLSNAVGFQANVMMTESVFTKVVRGSVNIAFFGVLGYIIWELFHALIERNLPMEEVDAIASLEGDGGGGGASRAETLVPLMRTVLTVVLSIFFLLTVLHAVGISIGPLLAGAGVVGIAIGFGAQKLVQDVISGIFFLIDDAFRRGEYIELEGLKGTVEKISLRSMQLRHHLGAVQTIPYGEIRTVKNLSRDWVTMKLELRLPYDTDIEKVRKIIKKVGQEMLEDPELGPCFILPLKSQGVMRVEESALIVRMKFTTKPGEQWVVRREAYRNVRDALAREGIHFAHREVRVLVPELEHPARTPEDRPDSDLVKNEGPAEQDASPSVEELKDRIAKTAAAAASGIIASEALKQGRLDSDDMDDEM